LLPHAAKSRTPAPSAAARAIAPMHVMARAVALGQCGMREF
jgi:hypothetical protein